MVLLDLSNTRLRIYCLIADCVMMTLKSGEAHCTILLSDEGVFFLSLRLNLCLLTLAPQVQRNQMNESIECRAQAM